MADQPIIQRIVIQGGKEVEAALNGIGKAGEDAFKRIQQSAAKASGASELNNLANATKGLGEAAATTGTRTARLANLFDTLGATSREAQSNVRGMGRAARDSASGLNRLGDDSDQAGKKLDIADISAIRLGQTMRLLGRAAGSPELSRLGRTIGVLGRAFQIASPVLLVAGMVALAAAASNAADKIQDLAAKNLVSNSAFQNTASAFAAVGVGIEGAARTFEALNTQIRQTADNTKQNEGNFRRMAGEIQEAREKAAELGREFVNIQRTATRAFQEFFKTTRNLAEQLADLDSPPSQEEQNARRRRDIIEQQRRAVRDLQDAQRKQREDNAKVSDQIDQEEKKIRETQKALADARQEAERNSTALQKLGIKATDASGRLRTVPGVLEDIADKLSGVSDSAERERIEQELVAAGLERRLLPVLRQGKDAFKALQEEGKRLQPPFNDAQLAQADKFLIAMDRAKLALGGLRDAIGLAIAPSLVPVFNKLTDLFVRIREPVAEFASVLGRVLAPVLTAIVTAFELLTSVVGTAFVALASLASVLLQRNVSAAEAATVAFGLLLLKFGGFPAAILAVVTAFGKLSELIDKLDLNPFVAASLKGLALLAASLILFPTTILAQFAKLMAAIRGMVLGAWIFIQATFITGTASISAALSGLVGSLVAFLPVLAAVAAAAVVFFLVWKNWDVVSKFAQDAFAKISSGAKSLWVDLQKIFELGSRNIGPILEILGTAALGVFRLIVAFVTNVVGPAFRGLMILLDEAARLINQTFGTTLSGTSILIGALVALVVAFAGLPGVILAVTVAMGFLIETFKDNKAVLTLIAIAVFGLVAAFATIPVIIALVVAAILIVIAKWEDIKAAASDATAVLRQKWQDFGDWFSTTWVGQIIGAIQSVIRWFNNLKAARDPALNQGLLKVDEGQGLARGGQVNGPGTGTSDSIPAWLSAGEFVHTAKAVRHYGVAFMHAINQLRVPRNMIRGFNLGGLVDRMQFVMPPQAALRFADGGPVPAAAAMHPVTIDLGNGQTVQGLRASGSVVRELQRASVARQVASAGRKPSYYGRGK